TLAAGSAATGPLRSVLLLEVEATRPVDLERDVVRLGLRVRRRPLRMRGRQRVGADLLEQALRARRADVGCVDLDRDRARALRGRRRRTLDAAGLLRAAETRLRVREHVWEARANRAQIDALRLAGVVARLV